MRCSRLLTVLGFSGAFGWAGIVPAQTLPSGVINAPPTVIGSGQSIGSNTTLNVMDGGSIGFDFDAGLPDGSSSNVVVNVGGGEVYQGFTANAGSTVNINEGAVRDEFTAMPGSTININGGFVQGGFLGSNGFTAASGSVVNIAGGVVDGLRAVSELPWDPDATVNLRGGLLWDGFYLGPSSQILGGDFQLNGEPYSGSTISLAKSFRFETIDTFSGTLMDGSPFVFSTAPHRSVVGDLRTALPASDELGEVSLTTATLPAVDLTPIVVDSAGGVTPNGLRPGQTLTLREGGELYANFVAVDATLNIEGGVVYSSAEVIGSTVNMSGGTVYGSTFGEFYVYDSTLNISGGVLPEDIEFFRDNDVNIRGAEFFAGQTPIVLDPGVPTVVDNQFGILSGRLEDGTPFELSSVSQISKLTLTSTAASTPGDYDGDGVVNELDEVAWRASLGQTVAPYSGADGNGDGVVNAADYAVLREHMPTAAVVGDADGDGDVDGDDLIAVQTNFGGVTPPSGDADGDGDVDRDDLIAVRTNFGAVAAVGVPEPAGCGMLGMVVLAASMRRRRQAHAR